jgi:2,3-bisphosphoglycerate-independent phosphoglycerate mutase
VYQEFTNRLLIKKGFDVPIFEPREAGEILARSAASYDFCLYEYFQTDGAGHSRSKDRALDEVRKLDEFLLALLENTDLRRMSILITSDHGNIEDLSVATHTYNPVPVLLWGALARRSPRIKSILDIVPLVLSALKCA